MTVPDFDVVIRGGQVVTDTEIIECYVAIRARVVAAPHPATAGGDVVLLRAWRRRSQHDHYRPEWIALRIA